MVGALRESPVGCSGGGRLDPPPSSAGSARRPPRPAGAICSALLGSSARAVAGGSVSAPAPLRGLRPSLVRSGAATRSSHCGSSRGRSGRVLLAGAATAAAAMTIAEPADRRRSDRASHHLGVAGAMSRASWAPGHVRRYLLQRANRTVKSSAPGRPAAFERTRWRRRPAGRRRGGGSNVHHGHRPVQGCPGAVPKEPNRGRRSNVPHQMGSDAGWVTTVNVALGVFQFDRPGARDLGIGQSCRPPPGSRRGRLHQPPCLRSLAWIGEVSTCQF